VLDRGRLLAAGTAADLRREFGTERCRITVREADLDRARAVVARFGASVNGGAPAGGGWVQSVFELPGGPGRMAELTAALVGAGAAVGGVAAVEPSLAELIERVLRARGVHAG
jgi:hypothetical protein